MSGWSGWSVDRAVLLFAALALLVVWAQLSLFHWAAAFRHRAMWAPVVTSPVVALGAVVGAIARDGVWGWIALALLAFGVLEGLVGLSYHLRGVVSQVGGLTLRNLISGPPPLLPAAYAALGVLGLGALIWNA